MKKDQGVTSGSEYVWKPAYTTCERTRSKTEGFTLIEIMTAISVFLLVMTISMGSILGVFDANRRSRSLRTVMANLNLAIENMSREMRYGQVYHCGSTGALTDPRNCASGEDFISFLSSGGEQVVYRLGAGRIERSTNGGASYIPVTAPEVSIDNLTFYTLGAGVQNPALQPRTLIKIQGHAGSGVDQTDFVLQTLVSQRSLDD